VSPSPLGEPFQLGSVTLKNRIVFAPMDRNYCSSDGLVTDRYIAYLAERAAGGAALIYPEAALVRADGRSQRNQMALDSDDVVPDLSRLADAVHREGALLGVQLNHGGNTSKPSITGFQPVAPSAVRSTFAGGPVPVPLDIEDIGDLVGSYADAAARSVDAGVDVVMIHAAHGYLIHQFMMPSINQRTDEYGDPARFLTEVIRAVRSQVPVTPVVLRISALDGVEGGLDEEGTLAILQRVPLDDVDCIDISAGSYEAPDLIIPGGEREQGWLSGVARRYRELGKPLGVAGRIATLDAAAEVLRKGDADLISVARALHADSGWAATLLKKGVRDAHQTAQAAARPCIAGNVCIDELGAGPIRCSVNPRAGRELLLPALPASSPRFTELNETLIVGAGPAGLETAVQLARWGVPVRLLEREPRLGGQFALAATLKGYPEYHRILDWYQGELNRLAIPLELSANVDVDELRARNPHALVMATGGVGARAEIIGAELTHVVDIRDWLRAPAATAPSSVVIWGGDREALAVGDDLAAQGVAVTFVFGGAVLGRDVGRLAKPYVMQRLGANPLVRQVPGSTVIAIEPTRCRVRSLEGRESWLDTPGPLLISQGAVPAPSILGSAELDAPPGGIWVVGDAASRGGSVADVLEDVSATVRIMLATFSAAREGTRPQPVPAE